MNALVQRYRHGFSGFAARLSAEEASSIAKKPGVVSVFPDPMLQLHTTRSWDFLKYQTDVKIDSHPSANSDSHGSDTVIGILDTGESLITSVPLQKRLTLIYLHILSESRLKTNGKKKKKKVFGQNQRVSMTRIWIQFQQIGKEPAWQGRISAPPIVTGENQMFTHM